jgi:hypothetical protein
VLRAACGIRLHVRDVEKIEVNAFLCQSRPLAAPVSEQILPRIKTRGLRGRVGRWRILRQRWHCPKENDNNDAMNDGPQIRKPEVWSFDCL